MTNLMPNKFKKDMVQHGLDHMGGGFHLFRDRPESLIVDCSYPTVT